MKKIIILITILISITSCKIGSNKSSLITSTIISAIKSIDYSKLGVFTIIKNSDYSYSGCINGNKFIYYHHTGRIDFLGYTPTISEMDQVKYGIFVLENYNLHTISRNKNGETYLRSYYQEYCYNLVYPSDGYCFSENTFIYEDGWVLEWINLY